MALTRQLYQFHVSLTGVQPVIWRRIQVPSKYSFWDLHVSIQDAMGWWDYHLHEFRLQNPETGEEERIGIPDDDGFEDDEPMLAGWEVKISRYFSEANPLAQYLYDFGDDWQHIVKLEDVLPRPPGRRYPVCLAGERRCPPEDCGGPMGYEQFLEAIRDPDHEEHESFLMWVGGSFDPAVFDPLKIKFDNPSRRWKKAFLEAAR